MAAKKAPEGAPDIKVLRERYTMSLGQVVVELGYPNRETLRRHIRDGKIMLSSARFGSNTSPHLYNPEEVARVKGELAGTVVVTEAGAR